MSINKNRLLNTKSSNGCFRWQLVVKLIVVVLLIALWCPFATAETVQKDEKTNYSYNGGDYYGIDQAAKSVFYVGVYKSDQLVASASGFVMFDEHLFVTNQHVIDGASKLVIMDDDGEQYIINQVVVSDKEHDIAILLFPDGYKYQQLVYDSTFDKLKRGQPVLAIGSPKGYFGTVSDGIISSFLKFRGEDIRYIQITAPISHGSSGGCLLNEELKVIGVTSGGEEQGENIGWAIPIFIAENLYSQWNKVDTIPLGTDASWDTVGHGLHKRISGTADIPKVKQESSTSKASVASFGLVFDPQYNRFDCYINRSRLTWDQTTDSASQFFTQQGIKMTVNKNGFDTTMEGQYLIFAESIELSRIVIFPVSNGTVMNHFNLIFKHKDQLDDSQADSLVINIYQMLMKIFQNPIIEMEVSEYSVLDGVKNLEGVKTTTDMSSALDYLSHMSNGEIQMIFRNTRFVVDKDEIDGGHTYTIYLTVARRDE